MLAWVLVCALAVPLIFSSFTVQAAVKSTTEQGIELIKKLEGFSRKAYEDGSQWSIGYGTSCEKGEYPNGITEEKAEELLRDRLPQYEGYVNNFLNKYGITVNNDQFDALVSFTYNLGNLWVEKDDTFFLRKYLIEGVSNFSPELIFAAFGDYCMAGSDILPGLVTRRQKEARLFLYGSPTGGPSSFSATVKSGWKLPLSAYPLSTDKMIAYQKPDGFERIYAAIDPKLGPCSITQIYTNGFCKVTYPTEDDGKGFITGYAPLCGFVYPEIEKTTAKAAKAIDTYRMSDMSDKFGSLKAGTTYTIVGEKAGAIQIVYPVSGGYRMAWATDPSRVVVAEIWEVNDGPLNVRKAPDATAGTVRDPVPNGTKLEITGQKETADNYTWGYAKNLGGWVALDYAELIEIKYSTPPTTSTKATTTTKPTVTPPPTNGDVDGKGGVNSADARLVLQYAVGLEKLSDRQLKAGDIDGDGAVNSIDARLILEMAVGL